MENLDPRTNDNIKSRLAGLLSGYSWRYNQRIDQTQEYFGLYHGYLDALRDVNIITVKQYCDLRSLCLAVQNSKPGKPKTSTECAELIQNALKD